MQASPAIARRRRNVQESPVKQGFLALLEVAGRRRPTCAGLPLKTVRPDSCDWSKTQFQSSPRDKAQNHYTCRKAIDECGE
jgi:hypothetical protein